MLPKRRDEFQGLLIASRPQIMSLLSQVCTSFSASSFLMRRTFLCFASWLRHVSETGMPVDLVASSPCIPNAFQVIASARPDESLFEAATDMIVEAIHYSQRSDEHSPLVSVLLPSVLQLVSR